jgi:predicted alpha/beta-hydrolase family hydrolase
VIERERPGVRNVPNLAVLIEQAEGDSRATFVCAHGAGGHMGDRGMTAVAQALRGVGFDVVRFNFAYRERGSKRPDPMPLLRERIVEAVAQAREQLHPRRLIIGGRSMGGRVASMLAANGFGATGSCCSLIRCTRRESRKNCVTRICRRSACRCFVSTGRATRCAGAT